MAEIKFYGNPKTAMENSAFNMIVKLAVQGTANAKRFAPVDLGRLRGSIMWVASNGQKKESGGFGDAGLSDGPPISPSGQGRKDMPTALIGTAVHYAIYQEYGTRFMVPSPFLRPAMMKQSSGSSLSQIRRELQTEFDTEFGKTKGGKNVIRF